MRFAPTRLVPGLLCRYAEERMPDERKESTAEGIAPAPESPIGRAAEERRREELIHAPVASRPDAGLGGTSDADTAADEAWTPKD
jgi:hypothetical protein